jgi:hypothetical protein
MSRSDIRVQVEPDHVCIEARSEPLTEILSRFAQATGAEIVYEAQHPRQMVSVRIEARTAGDALTQLLEGQGLNYALRLDASGGVEMLVITGSASATAASGPADRIRRSSPLPEPATPEVPEEFLEADAEPDTFAGAAPPSEPLGSSPGDAASPVVPALQPGSSDLGPGVQPTVPGAPTSVEPSPPQPPVPASYPSLPVPSQPASPTPVSYPGTPGE